MTLILSGTDGLSDVDGSAATPAIRGTDANTGIFFPSADVIAFSEGGVESARFNSSGNLQTIGTISVGNATPSTSGAGITFPASQSASSNANTLDDYEEGTWTPGVESDSVVTGTTYSTRTGFYRKVGQLVTVNLRIVVSNWGSGGTGVFYITGLPFPCLNMGINMTCGGFYMDNPTMPSGRTWAVPQAISNNSYMTFIASGNAAGATTMTWAQVTAGNDMTLGLTYFSAS